MVTYTLAFDIYGTLIDTSGVLDSLKKMIGKSAGIFMNTWRNKQLEYAFRRGLMDAYVDFSVCTKEALDYTCHDLDITLTQDQKLSLLQEYKTLPVFPDVSKGLELLQNTNHSMYAFSNGSYQAIKALLDNANIEQFFDGIVSVEDVKMFKPSPLVYQHFNTKTNSTKDTSWLISSNPFDAIGATSYGMKSIWVQRLPTSVFDPWGIHPTETITTITQLKDLLEKYE